MSTGNEQSIIGEGTYGTVLSCPKGVIKKMQLIVDNCMIGGAIREICFTKSFYHPFTVTANKITLPEYNNTDTLEAQIEMEKFGCDLFHLNSKITNYERLVLWPYIIYVVSVVIESLNACGLGHNDIKPGNILVDENFNVRVIDWGSMTHSPATCDIELCTFSFAAPEQLLKRRITATSDIYSLGRTISFLLTNKFYGEDHIRNIFLLGKSPKIYSNPIGIPGSQHFLQKCEKLVRFDSKERPLAIDIINWNELKNLKESLGNPLYAMVRHDGSAKSTTKKERQNRAKYVKYLCDMNEELKDSYTILVHAIWILDQIRPKEYNMFFSLATYFLACLLHSVAPFENFREENKWMLKDIYSYILDILNFFDMHLFVDNFVDMIHYAELPVKRHIIVAILADDHCVTANAKTKFAIYKSRLKR